MALFRGQRPRASSSSPRTTGGNSRPAHALPPMRRSRDGAEIIVGPLLSESVAGVAPAARQAGVPVLAFSNNAQVAGDGVYLASFLAEQEGGGASSRTPPRAASAASPLLIPGRCLRPPSSKPPSAAPSSAMAARWPSPSATPLAANGMLGPAKRIVEADQGRRGADAPPSMRCSFPAARTGCRRSARSSPMPASTPRRSSCSAPAPGISPSISREAAFVGGWYPSPRPDRLARLLGAFRQDLRHGAAAHRLGGLRHPRHRHRPVVPTRPGQRYTAANLTRTNGFSGVDGIVPLQCRRHERARPCRPRGAEVRLRPSSTVRRAASRRRRSPR